MLILFYLLILIVPGFFAMTASEFVSRHRMKYTSKFIWGALMFDLVLLIINLFWLRFIKLIQTINDLLVYFNCLSFTVKFAILSIVLAILLGIIVGILCKCTKIKHHCYRE